MRTLASFILVGLLACGTQALIPASKDASLFFEKTMCFGLCPAFTFELFSDGTAQLVITRPFRESRLEVLETGRFDCRIDASAAASILHNIQKTATQLGYAQLDSLYDNPRVTDLPSTITEIDGHRVTNRYGGPPMNSLYEQLQIVMDDLDWQPLN